MFAELLIVYGAGLKLSLSLLLLFQLMKLLSICRGFVIFCYSCFVLLGYDDVIGTVGVRSKVSGIICMHNSPVQGHIRVICAQSDIVIIFTHLRSINMSISHSLYTILCRARSDIGDIDIYGKVAISLHTGAYSMVWLGYHSEILNYLYTVDHILELFNENNI
jgi:hypothetical protein